MQKIVIEFVGDILCPWCFLGKKRLEKAINQVGDLYEFELRWGPYQLYPNIPEGGIDKRELTKWRPFPKGLAKQLRDEAAIDAVDLDYRQVERIPNTLAAHRLVWLAETVDVQIELAMQLYKAYLLEGKNIEDMQTLSEIGRSAGLQARTVERYQKSDAGRQEVLDAIETYRNRGIMGVPAFILNDRKLVMGAQEPETFVKYFKRAV